LKTAKILGRESAKIQISEFISISETIVSQYAENVGA